MKICYLILAHDKAQQLIRLVEALQHPSVSFVIHLDRKMSDLNVDALKRSLHFIDSVYFADRRLPVYWGTYSIIEATFSCLATMHQKQLNPARVCLLSGSHYPIKSNNHILDFFAKNPNSIFMDYTRLEDRERWKSLDGGLQRFTGWHFYWRGKRYRRPLIGLLLKKRPVLRGVTLYGGSQWWCVPGDVAVWMLEKYQTSRKFNRYFSFSEIPDEHYFQTMLLNSSHADAVINQDLTYKDWQAGAWHPRHLTASDISTLQATKELFARKFDVETDSTVINEINEKLLEPSR